MQKNLEYSTNDPSRMVSRLIKLEKMIAKKEQERKERRKNVDL